MIRFWNEKHGRNLISKLVNYKFMDYRLIFLKAAYMEGRVKLKYIFEKDGFTESFDVDIPENGTVPSATEIFPEGAQMESEIADTYPLRFVSQKKVSNPEEKQGNSLVEWGPFHPLLQEPVLFSFSVKDGIIGGVNAETGYNRRGIESLCAGEKIPYVLDMLERISSINGFSAGLAFLIAVEEINRIAVPAKANLLRLILNEMSFLRANLYSLSHITRCLGLLSDNSEIFKLISLYYEAVSLISEDRQLKGILVPGGINRDIDTETLLRLNVVLQETANALASIRDRWSKTPFIAERMSAIGKIDKETARAMTGRPARSAGFCEDTRKFSHLPYHMLSYKLPVTDESNCFTRTMLMFEDALLSLSLIDQAVEIMPEGEVYIADGIKNKGEVLVREPEAFGELVMYVALEDGIVTDLKIRNSSSLNFSFISRVLKGNEVNDAPLIIATLDYDFSGMEK